VITSLMHWLDAKRLEFSALSAAGKAIRVIKHASWIAALITIVGDSVDIWEKWQALTAAPVTFEAVVQFVAANGRVILFLAISLVSWMIDMRMSKSILQEIQAHDFYGIERFSDIVGRLNKQEESVDGRVDKLDHNAGWTHPATNKQLILRVGAGRPVKFSIKEGTWLAYDPSERSAESRGRQLLRFVVARAVEARQRVFNGRKVRMCCDLNEGLISGVIIQQTDYLSSMMTDGLAFQHVSSLSDRVEYSDGWSYFLYCIKGSFRLRSLADTESSNQLGASTLAFTRDGYLMLVYQTRRNAHSGGKIAPSGSGSLDWEDVTAVTSGDFLDVVRRGAARELIEESGLEGHRDFAVDVVASEYVLPYAFSRIIRRAGKPEFFCLGYLPLTIEELVRYKPKRRELIYTVKSFASRVARFDRNRDPRAELERICDHYSQTDQMFPIANIAERFALSYQVMHGLALLREALQDKESAAIILSFIRRHFAIENSPNAPG
jgi:hypothetical protein